MWKIEEEKNTHKCCLSGWTPRALQLPVVEPTNSWYRAPDSAVPPAANSSATEALFTRTGTLTLNWFVTLSHYTGPTLA